MAFVLVGSRSQNRPVLGVFGGSFNPPHVVHQFVALWALSCTEVERVLWLPTYAHAFGKSLVAFEDRMAMARLAAASLGTDVIVSDIERSLPAPSRTLQTLQALQQKWPTARFRLLIGADILQETEAWHRWDEVALMAPPLVVGRGQITHSVTMPDISSTQVRARLAAGKSVQGLVPTAVIDYIHARGLYRAL